MIFSIWKNRFYNDDDDADFPTEAHINQLLADIVKTPARAPGRPPVPGGAPRRPPVRRRIDYGMSPINPVHLLFEESFLPLDMPLGSAGKPILISSDDSSSDIESRGEEVVAAFGSIQNPILISSGSSGNPGTPAHLMIGEIYDLWTDTIFDYSSDEEDSIFF